MKSLVCLVVFAGAALAQDAAARYPELRPEDFGDAEKFRALEDDVNAFFDAEGEAEREARLAAVERSLYAFRVVEAVVRRGRRYGDPGERIVGNVSLPEKYDPARPVPVLVGFNGLTAAMEREASWRGYATIYPWKIGAWVDPRTTDRVIEQLWEASRRVNIDFDRLYATGASVGGHGTWVAAAMRTDAWAGMIPVSGSPGRILVAMSEVYLKNMHHLALHSTVGADDDEITDMARKGQAVAKKFGLPVTLEVVEGRGHESFDDRAEALLAWTSELRRARYPAKLDFYGGGDLGRRHYWVEALGDTVKSRDLVIDTPTGTVVRELPIRPLQVQAEIEGQTVSIHTKNITRLRVLLADPMLDFDQEVVIKVNGQVAWKGTPARSVRTLLESSLHRKDRLRTFAWARELDCP